MVKKSLKKITIFLSYPNDVLPERNRLKSIVDRLNQPGNVADNLGFFLEVWDWRTNSTSQAGFPQEIIFKQLPVNKWDIYVGILWSRFGEPTGAIDPDTGKKYLSGVEEEFKTAYRMWKVTKFPL